MPGKRRWLLAGLFALAIVSTCYGQQAQGEEIDTDSVRRLGDRVEKVDGFQGPEDLFAQAMELPPDDKSKWFISFLTLPNCPGCDDLKAKWSANPNLLALAKLDRGKAAESWAHFNEYSMADRSQAHRFGNVTVDSYPVVLVQPPESGEYGPSTTVVYKATGSQLTRLTGDDLHRQILAAINAYCEKLAASRPVQAGSPAKPASAIPVEGTNRLPPWPFDPAEAPAGGFLPVLPKDQTAEVPPRSLIDGASEWAIGKFFSGLYGWLDGVTGGHAQAVLIAIGALLLARYLGYTPADAKAWIEKQLAAWKKKAPGAPPESPATPAASDGPLSAEAEKRIADLILARLQPKDPPGT